MISKKRMEKACIFKESVFYSGINGNGKIKIFPLYSVMDSSGNTCGYYCKYIDVFKIKQTTYLSDCLLENVFSSELQIDIYLTCKKIEHCRKTIEKTNAEFYKKYGNKIKNVK
jgi:hypothetical protein